MKNITQLAIGRKYGLLTIQEETGRDKWKQKMFLCLCDCGGTKIVTYGKLQSGKTKSCGCLLSHNKTHGLSKHRLSGTWQNINNRCYKENIKQYKDYGGRGIGNYWKNDFAGFYNYITSLDKYGEAGMTIERIDNDKGYMPGNLKLATHAEQNSNTRRSIKYNGESAIDASIRLGGNRSLVKSRLSPGWTKEKAFTLPARKLNKYA